MIADLLVAIIDRFITGAERLFDLVFGGVQFNVLWSWLPSDIGNAASVLIAFLFALAFIAFCDKFLPI